MTVKRKIGLALLALLLIGGALLYAFRPWLAERAFQRGLDTTVGVDLSLALGDGLHAYVCGSGSPMPDAARAGPCLAVLAGDKAFVFDAGAGSIRKLGRMGFPMDKLQAAFLTHLHSDHFDGLGELLLQAWIAGGRSAPLPVYGPEGTDRLIAGLMMTYEADKGFRIAHHGPAIARPGGFGGEPHVIAFDQTDTDADGVVYQGGGVTIRAVEVDHAPIAPAFGYRIDYKGRSIVISGDTVYSAPLEYTAKGADLLVHEALNKRMVARLGAALAWRGRKDTAQIMTDIQNYHATPEDAARLAKAAGVKTLLLTHLVPAPPAKLLEPMFLGGAPKIFPGVRLAHDGMIVSLPAGSREVRFSEGL
ncbi:MAG: MBL fold metallo-hydrolase [Novosphingobium sp.]